MTYAEAFSKIKKKLEKADTKALNQDFAIQVTIKDEDAAGTFYVANINGEFSVEPYDYRDNSVAVDVTVTDFTKLIEGKLTSEKALSSGKIDAFGDAAALDFITGIVKPTPRKTAAKKETAKKTTAKKETPAKKTKRKTTAVKEEKTAAAAEAAPAAKSDEKPAKKSPAKNTDK